MNPSSSSIHSNRYESSSEGEDEGDFSFSRDEDEDEQERLLSKEHGEAAEANTANKKRGTNTDADIARALESADANNPQRAKKFRPTLTETMLTGSHGLIRIRQEFPSKLKYRAPSQKQIRQAPSRQARLELEVEAASLYTSQLLSAFRSFCTDLIPSWNYKDTLNRIEDLGSKKIVRDFLQNNRNDVCRTRLVELYGEEKATRWLNELEHGLKTNALFSDSYNVEVDNATKDEDIENSEERQQNDGNNTRQHSIQNASEKMDSSSGKSPYAKKSHSAALQNVESVSEEKEMEFSEDNFPSSDAQTAQISAKVIHGTALLETHDHSYHKSFVPCDNVLNPCEELQENQSLEINFKKGLDAQGDDRYDEGELQDNVMRHLSQTQSDLDMHHSHITIGAAP